MFLWLKEEAEIRRHVDDAIVIGSQPDTPIVIAIDSVDASAERGAIGERQLCDLTWTLTDIQVKQQIAMLRTDENLIGGGYVQRVQQIGTMEKLLHLSCLRIEAEKDRAAFSRTNLIKLVVNRLCYKRG